MNTIPLFLALILPFIKVLRGGKLAKSFFIAWGALIFSYLFFSILLPCSIVLIDRHIASIMCNYLPQPPFVVAMLFLGWIFAGIAVFLAYFIRVIIQKSNPPSEPF